MCHNFFIRKFDLSNGEALFSYVSIGTVVSDAIYLNLIKFVSRLLGPLLLLSLHSLPHGRRIYAFGSFCISSS